MPKGEGSLRVFYRRYGYKLGSRVGQGWVFRFHGFGLAVQFFSGITCLVSPESVFSLLRNIHLLTLFKAKTAALS